MNVLEESLQQQVNNINLNLNNNPDQSSHRTISMLDNRIKDLSRDRTIMGGRLNEIEDVLRRHSEWHVANAESENSEKALQDVLAERNRQDIKWGEQNHDPFTYLAILTEEVGELAQAAVELRFDDGSVDDMKTEAVHVAAVALAIVECLERGKWAWPTPKD